MRAAAALLLLVLAGTARADAEIPVGSGPSAVAVNPITGTIFVANRLDDTVTVIDAATLTTTTVAVVGRPNRLDVDPIHNRVFVLGETSGQYTILDGRTLATQTRDTGGQGRPTRLALDPADDAHWMTTEFGAVLRNGDTLLEASVSEGIAVDPVTHRAYVSTRGLPPLVLEVDAANLDYRAWVPAPSIQPMRVAFDPALDRIVFSHTGFEQGLKALDGASLFEIASADGPDFSTRFLLDVVRRRVWWTGAWSGSWLLSDRALDALAFSQIPDSSTSGNYSSTGATVLSPATNRLYLHRIDDSTQSLHELAVKDGDDLSAPLLRIPIPSVALAGEFVRPAVNVATNRVYVATANDTLLEIDEPEIQPVPIAVSMWNEPPSPAGDVRVHVRASSASAATLPVRRIWVQRDAIDGAWTPATPAGDAASILLPGVPPGAHVVHAMATDGREATLVSDVHGTPVVSPPTSLPIFVSDPQPHVDVELGSPISQLPRDGAFPFQLALANATGGPQTFALLLSLDVPGAGAVSLLPATGMQLPDGVGFATTVHIPIAASFPTGIYTLGAIVLQAGGAIADQSVITFTVE